jgi:hypothetical protein
LPQTSLTPEERTLRARKGAHSMHAKNDSKETSARGRAVFLARFLDEVDPDRVLPEAERLRRAEHALKAYMTGLALKSARARRKRAGGGDA